MQQQGKRWVRGMVAGWLVALALWAGPPARGQTILGKSPYDKFAAAFWAQNTNADAVIWGLNKYAVTMITNPAALPYVAGANVTLTPQANGTISVAASGGGGGGGGQYVAAGTNLVATTNGAGVVTMSTVPVVLQTYGVATNLTAAQLAVGGTPLDYFANWPLQVVGTNYLGNLLAGWDNVQPSPVVGLSTSGFYMTNYAGNSGVAMTGAGELLLVGSILGSLYFSPAGNLTLGAGGTMSGNGSGLTGIPLSGLTTGGSYPAGSGAAITALNGTQLTSGTVPSAALGNALLLVNTNKLAQDPTNGLRANLVGTYLNLANTNSLAQDPTNGLRANLVGTYLNLANTNKLAQDLTNGVTAWAVTTNDARALTLSGTLNLGTANGLTVVNASNVVAGNIQSPALISSLVGADSGGNLVGASTVLPLTYNAGGQTISINPAANNSAGSMSAADYQTMRTNIARLNGTNTFSGTNNFNGIVDFTGAYVYFTDNLDIGNGDNIYLTNGVYYGFGSGSFVAGATGGFTGNGANLTNLNATQLTSGTVPAAALGNAWQTAAVNVNTGNSNYLTRFDYTGPTPTIQTNGGNGIGGSAQISGTDGRGFITLTTGTALVASTNFYTVTFNRPYNNVPTVIVTSFATNAGASWSAANQVLIAQHCSTGATTTGFFLMGDTTIFAANKNIYMQYQVTGD